MKIALIIALLLALLWALIERECARILVWYMRDKGTPQPTKEEIHKYCARAMKKILHLK